MNLSHQTPGTPQQSAERSPVSPARRALLGVTATLGAASITGCASIGSASPSIGRVVVVGGGFGGATVARYLKRWGGNVDVTLVEREAAFVPARFPTSSSAVTSRLPTSPAATRASLHLASNGCAMKWWR